MMIKGSNKKIFHVKNVSSKYFDEAYFILRHDSDNDHNYSESATLAEEANRIILESALSYKLDKKKKHAPQSRVLSFTLGAFSASAIIGVAAFLMSL